ncbi:MAG: dockerin type I repeat-containing protein, partial [Muribaculaceae bacterium]|nr:dockerin type I repeat-containing protein [Muribaculaceae bacterium]
APATVDIFGETVGFYFSNATKKFIKPTKSFKSGIARSYLKLSSSLAGSTSTIYVDQWYEGLKGDVNGDGVVNVSDVTALINKILGTASYSNEVCDIDGNGAVNVSDVTALINLILG